MMKLRLDNLRKVVLAVMLLVTVSANASREGLKLGGTPIGSNPVNYGGGYQYAEYAFDGDLNTYYASEARSYTWVGLDLGSEHIITSIGFCPRKDFARRTLLGVFEGSNREDFLDAVPLYIIPEVPVDGSMTYVPVNVSRGFRYVRYVGPSDVRCNIAEIEFYGMQGVGTDNTFYQLTNLPTLSIHTYSGAEVTSKDYELEANVTITYDGCRIQEYPILVKGRGNASWSFPKKPMRIKFNDGKSHHMLKDSPLESPAKSKKWTLINNYGDKTLMRNIVAFEFSKRLGLPYTPYCQPVDVLLNGEYKGCYQLCDQISVDPARVPVTELTPDDNTEPNLTGGYLVEIDAYANQEVSWFTSSKGIPVTIKSPDADEITSAQSNYIRKYFNLLEQRLWASNYTDETSGYRSVLDVESFLKHFIVGEFSGNTDTYWSTYMYKDREDNIFKVSPVWDFDLAFENDSRTYPVCDRSDWVFRSGGSTANGMGNFVSRVLSDPYADKRLRQIWSDMRKSKAFGRDELLSFVDSMAQVLDASQRLNFTRWPILNVAVHLNNTPKGSYEGEVAVLRNYLIDRISWIDQYLTGESPDVPADTIYNISTPEQLIEFARLVNSGATGSQGVLMADLDMSDYGENYVPIGSQAHPFHGLFDGQGHTINNLVINGGNNFGVFGTVTGGATIRNFVLGSGSGIYGGSYVGIVGVSTGSGTITIERVGNEGSIVGTGRNVAAIIGCNMNSSATFVIRDCYNTGAAVSQGGEGGVITGWAGSNAVITGCWNIGSALFTDGGRFFARYGSNLFMERCYSINGDQATIISEDDVQSGRLCYLLNAGQTEDVSWYQRIGEDARPYFDPERGTVYSLSPLHCNGVPYDTGSGFTNNATEVQRDEHHFIDYVCTYCGTFNENFADKDERGYYMIATPGQLECFISYANSVDPYASAVLTADIDFSPYGTHMLGQNEHYAGTFDGAGHTVNVDINSHEQTCGFIRHLDGTVMDLTVTGNIYTTEKYAGGICGQMYGAKLLRCHSSVDIYSTVNGDGTHGGMTGIVNDDDGMICEIESCLFSGKIRGDRTDCCGGFVGWATGSVYIQNSLMIGDISVGSNGSDIYCRNNGNMFGMNNYYYTDWWPSSYPWSDCYETNPSDIADGTLLAQLRSGAENWKQDIPGDPHPLPYIKHPVTETIELAKGWNWISHSLEAEVSATGVKEAASIIRSQTEESFLDEELGWVGNVGTLQPLTSYKVNSLKDCSIALNGMDYDLSEPVHLHKGWNWVGVPVLTYTADEMALIGFQPSDNDRITGQEGFAAYWSGAWTGGLDALQPGQGYMVYTQQEQTLQWAPLAERSAKARSLDAEGRDAHRAAALNLSAELPSRHLYPNVMNAIITVDGAQDGAEVLAYSGEECRAHGVISNGLCFLTIYGDGGEQVMFRVSEGGSEKEADQVASFRSLGMLGSAESPYVLSFDSATGISSLPTEDDGNANYYSIDGRRVSRPGHGLYIRQSFQKDGTVSTTTRAKR